MGYLDGLGKHAAASGWSGRQLAKHASNLQLEQPQVAAVTQAYNAARQGAKVTPAKPAPAPPIPTDQK